MRHRLVLLVALLLPLAAHAAEAQSYSVKVCNNSGRGKAWIAQHYYNVDAQNGVVQGWWGLDNGQCTTFTHSLGTGSPVRALKRRFAPAPVKPTRPRFSIERRLPIR